MTSIGGSRISEFLLVLTLGLGLFSGQDSYGFLANNSVTIESDKALESIRLQGDITVAFCRVGGSASTCKQAAPNWKPIEVELKVSPDGSSASGSTEFSVKTGPYEYIAQIQINKTSKGELVDYRLYVNLYTLEIARGIYIYRGDMLIHFPSLEMLNSFSFSPHTIDGNGGFFIPRIFLNPNLSTL